MLVKSKLPIKIARALTAVCLLSLSSLSNSQGLADDDVKRIFDAVEPYVVQLRVTGTLGPNARRTEIGTGVIFFNPSAPRIMTAGHVVGLDSEFDADPAFEDQRKRDVWVRRWTDLGAVNLDPVHLVSLYTFLDVAQVFVEGSSRKGPHLSAQTPSAADTLLVISWPDGRNRPDFAKAQVLPRQASDGSLIRLDAEFLPSASGSPVFNKQGDVVAILIRASTVGGKKTTMAAPVSEFTGWLSAGTIQSAAVQGPAVEFIPPLGIPLQSRETRTPPLTSGVGSNFSQFYRLCNDPIPQDAKIVSKEFFLVGDRTCGAWSECRLVEDTPQRVCFEFRMQGHNEALLQNSGVRTSEGVLRVNYK